MSKSAAGGIDNRGFIRGLPFKDKMNNTNSSEELLVLESLSHESAVWVIAQVVLWGCIFVISSLGNSLVLLCIVKSNRLHSSIYAFYGSLAASDCIAGMLCCPLLLVTALHQLWIMGKVMCHVYSTLLSTSLNASIATLCLISMDRLNAVCKPFEYRGHNTFTQRWCKWLLVLSWVHSIFWAAAPLGGWGEIITDSATYTCKPNWSAASIVNRSYSLCLALFPFAFPVFLMVAIYCVIYRHTKKCSNLMSGLEDGRNLVAEQERQMRERRLFRTVLIIIGAFAACWAIYTLATTCKLFIGQTPPTWLVQLGLICAIAGSCVNPVIYTIRDATFARELGRLHPCMAWLLKQSFSKDSGSREQVYTVTCATRASISRELLDVSRNNSRETLSLMLIDSVREDRARDSKSRNSMARIELSRDDKARDELSRDDKVRDELPRDDKARDELSRDMTCVDEHDCRLSLRSDLTRDMYLLMRETNL